MILSNQNIYENCSQITYKIQLTLGVDYELDNKIRLEQKIEWFKKFLLEEKTESDGLSCISMFYKNF